MIPTIAIIILSLITFCLFAKLSAVNSKKTPGIGYNPPPDGEFKRPKPTPLPPKKPEEVVLKIVVEYENKK